MAKQHGPWVIEGSVEKLKNRWIEVREDQVIRPDGGPGTFTSVKLSPGVSVLALDDTGQAHLTCEFRYAVGRGSIEVVSGAIDEGEEPLAAARRELREELGIEAEQWTNLGLVDALTSQLLCPATLFLARQLSFREPERETTEQIEHLVVPFAEAVGMVMESRITHAPSCVLILKASKYLRSPLQPDVAHERRS
ncbi:MAG TPA: NUDIX hydrolase [Pyrinomonadaceae bacterium]|nr:NUDIX hydrolase [Pyrinomonadaceae bacterium]